MKNFIPVGFLLLIALIKCGRNDNDFDVSDAPLDSVPIYFNLIENEKRGSSDKANYLLRLKTAILRQPEGTSKAENLDRLLEYFNRTNNQSEFKKTIALVLQNATVARDTLAIAKAYKGLGNYYINQNQNDSSYYYYIKAEKLSLYLRDFSSLGDIYLDKAFIELYASDFYSSEISASKALRFLNQGDNKFKVYDAYNLIGICSNQLKNYEKALEYHNKALDCYRENNLKSKFHLNASSLNNIGYVYQNINKHQLAIANFNKALSDPTLFGDNPSLYSMLLDNLAYSKFQLGDYRQLPDLFYKSLKIRDSLKTDLSGIILNKIHLSEFYYSMGDTLQSQKIAKETLEFSRETKVASDILASLRHLSKVEYRNAAKYAQEYIKINDSLQQAERIAKEKFARIKLETDEISSENDKLEEQNRSLLYFFIGTLMIGMLLFVIRTQRSKNRELLLKQAQQKANEEIYNLMISQQNTIEESRTREKKRIAQELHDGVLGRLFGARLNLDSLNRQSTEDAVSKRNDYLTELKNIEQDIREISHDLNREKYVLINNFIAILNNLIEEQKNSFAPDIIVSIDEEIKWEAVENTSKIHLYRIIQESLQNINKYANATTIRLDIKKSDRDIILNVVDDGDGFSVNTKKKGIGLQNMISRTHELNGTFDIRSKKGKGTTISVSFPVMNEQLENV